MVALAVVAICVVGAIATVIVRSETRVPTTPATGIGSCWAVTAEKDMFEPVDCSNEDAFYRVVSRVATPDSCPNPYATYFKDGDGVFCTDTVYAK